MNNRRFQATANNYTSVAIDADRIARSVGNYLASVKKASDSAIEKETAQLLKWAAKAEVGERLVRDDYTVIVLDGEQIHNNALIGRI